MFVNKQDLRKKLLARIRALNLETQALAAENLASKAIKLACFCTAKNLAIYWPHNGEISPLPILYKALDLGKNCFLPVLRLQPTQSLLFASYDLTTPLLNNRYNILEPDLAYAKLIALENIDLIFVPLLGFDKYGSRLGRGAGFYDATLSRFEKIHDRHQPLIIGLAFSCQEVEQIPSDSWDKSLDFVITDKKIFDFRTN